MSKGEFSPNTSTSLLLRIRNPEDDGSWEEFERIYGKIVRSYCRQRNLQETDSDDIVQEVMAAVARAIRTFEYDPAKGRFRSWLGTITANKIKDFLGKRSRRKESQAGPEESLIHSGIQDPDSDWVAIFSQQVFAEACQRARPNFEEKTWLSFELTWKNNVAASETARMLNIPTHSVYVNKSRVIKRLESEIKLLAEDLAFDFSNQPFGETKGED